MTTVSLKGKTFSYTISPKSIRSINLRLVDCHSFAISCPHLTPRFIINQFIHTHANWIVKNSSKIITPIPVSSAAINRAKKIIITELQQLARQHHFHYGRVSVRNQKTRLGSCSPTGNLSFNWRITLFPLDKFRHVLFHELVHLTIKNHSPRFWAALSVYDPNWHHNRKWIRSQSLSPPDNDPTPKFLAR